MTLSRTAVVLQAYRYALDPTPGQQGALASHTGASRFAYNWGLQCVREWNKAKHEAARWWAGNSKEAYSSGLTALARALKNWQDSKHGRRAGRPMAFPGPKRKGRAPESCRFATGAIRVEADRHHVTLPRLGRIRTQESTRKLTRRLEQGLPGSWRRPSRRAEVAGLSHFPARSSEDRFASPAPGRLGRLSPR